MAMFPVRVRCTTVDCRWHDQLQVVKLPTEGQGSVVMVPKDFMCGGCRMMMKVETKLGRAVVSQAIPPVPKRRNRGDE